MQNSKIESSIMGRWQPKNLTCEPVIGLVECKDGFVELKIVSATKVDWLENSEPLDLFGILEDGRRITLCDCFVSSKRRSWRPAEIFTYGVFVNFYVLGIHFDKRQRNISSAYIRFDELGILYEYRGGNLKESRKCIVLQKPQAVPGHSLNLCGVSIDFVPFERGSEGGLGKFSFERVSSLQARLKKKTLSTFREIFRCCELFEMFFVVASKHLLTNFQFDLVVKKKLPGKWQCEFCSVFMRNDLRSEGKPAHPTDCVLISEFADLSNTLKCWELNFVKFSNAIFLYAKTLNTDEVTVDELQALTAIIESISGKLYGACRYSKSDIRSIRKVFITAARRENFAAQLILDADSAIARSNHSSFTLRLLRIAREYSCAFCYCFPEDRLAGIVDDVVRFRNEFAHVKQTLVTIQELQRRSLALLFSRLTIQILLLQFFGMSRDQIIISLSDKWWFLRLTREIDDALNPDYIVALEGDE